MKCCIISSAGGHFTEIQELKEIYKKYKYFYITFKRVDTLELAKNNKVYFIVDPKRNPLKLIKNTFQSFWILKKERPDLIISTGAGVAIMSCFLGRVLFGSKVIFIESRCRILRPSLTGKLIKIIADLYIWEKGI